MNVEIGAEAALLPEKEYINGIAVAVWWGEGMSSTLSIQLVSVQCVTTTSYAGLLHRLRRGEFARLRELSMLLSL
jgi:hypothetical protein